MAQKVGRSWRSETIQPVILKLRMKEKRAAEAAPFLMGATRMSKCLIRKNFGFNSFLVNIFPAHQPKTNRITPLESRH